MLKYALVLKLLLCLTSTANARVLDLNSSSWGSYLLFNMGSSTVSKSAYENEASTSYTYSSGVKYNLGSEFGFTYFTKLLNYRFGIEFLRPDSVSGVSAKNGASTVYEVSSNVTMYVPKIGAEINLRKDNNTRSFVFATMGTATLNGKNSYASSTIAPTGTHNVEFTGSAQEITYGIGQEGMLADTTTYLFEFGSRTLNMDSLKYKSAVTTFSGAKAEGAALTDVSGTARTLDFSSFYISLGIRIYLN